MKNNIVITIFTFHIFFAVGMEQEKFCSIFENSPNYETYRNIFEKIVGSKQVQESENFCSIENLVADMGKNNLKTIENYMKTPISKYAPLSYTCPYWINDLEKKDESLYPNFQFNISSFSNTKTFLKNFLFKNKSKKWTKASILVLYNEYECWNSHTVLSHEAEIDYKYLEDYLDSGGDPEILLENATRFFAKNNIKRLNPVYSKVIEYSFKRYPLCAARFLVNFALKKTENLQEKKVALAIVKSYNMLHVAENDPNLIQRIVNNREAQELFFNYGQ